MRRELYPDDWEAISREVRDRSGGRCECEGECGLHRGRRCVERHAEPARWARGKVTLTVHHLDGDKQNSDRKNLKAMCNRCHLRCDSKINSEQRKRVKDAEAGQMRLIP